MSETLSMLWQHRRTGLQGVIWGLLGGAMIVMVFLAFAPAVVSTARERQLCGEAVNTVLTTQDPLELERAKFLIEQIRGCQIRL